MLRTIARVLVSGLVAAIIALGVPGFQASAHADEPPTGDCVTMVTLVLGGVAIRSGAVAYAVGEGAIYANAGSLISTVTGIASSYNCAAFLVPHYIEMVCQQSRQGLRYRKTWEARAIISFATRGYRTQC